jgi:hypothetical protein
MIERDELLFLFGYLEGTLSTIKRKLLAGDIQSALKAIDDAEEKCKPLSVKVYEEDKQPKE